MYNVLLRILFWQFTNLIMIIDCLVTKKHKEKHKESFRFLINVEKCSEFLQNS